MCSNHYTIDDYDLDVYGNNHDDDDGNTEIFPIFSYDYLKVVDLFLFFIYIFVLYIVLYNNITKLNERTSIALPFQHSAKIIRALI